MTFRYSPLGGRAIGNVSKREFDFAKIGTPIRRLTTNTIKVTHRGIDFVERHLTRFPPDKANQAMVKRLRTIADGKLQSTPPDLNFYAHELRENVRYKLLGYSTGQPQDISERHALWNNAHSATLEDYRIKENRDSLNNPLYHPDAAKYIPG